MTKSINFTVFALTPTKYCSQKQKKLKKKTEKKTSVWNEFRMSE